MDYTELLEWVEASGGLNREQAERAAQATLATLAERITRGEADELADQLPRELQAPLLKGSEPAEPFDLDEFVRRVAVREGVPPASARAHARAVLSTLQETVGEMEHVQAQLPREFEALLR